MRLILTLSAFAVLSLTSVTVADDKVNPVPSATRMNSPAPVVQVSQSRGGAYQTVRRQNQNFFGRIMEVERRKNAWLRRTFM